MKAITAAYTKFLTVPPVVAGNSASQRSRFLDVSDEPGSSADQRRLLFAHNSQHDIFGQMSLSGQT